MKKLLPYIISISFFAVLLPLVTLTVQFIFYSLMPYSYWFEYESVEPQSNLLYFDDSLIFLSTFEVYKPTKLSWNDRLYCKCTTGRNCDSHSFLLQASFESKTVKKAPEKKIKSPWVWEGVPPLPPSICYLESQITAELPFGIEKTQIINGKEFFIN